MFAVMFVGNSSAVMFVGNSSAVIFVENIMQYAVMFETKFLQ